MSKYAHKGQILPLINQMVPISKDTSFHASYDHGLHGFNQGEIVEPIGPEQGVLFPGGNGHIFDLPFGNGWNPLNEDVVIEMWAKANSLFTGRMVMGCTNGANERFYIGVGTGSWELGIQGRAWSGGAVPLTTEWTHLKIVASKGVASLYVDGVLSDQENYTSYQFTSNLAVGGMNGGGYPWNGAIANLSIRKGGELIAHYRLNEQEGLILYDASGNGQEAKRNDTNGIQSVDGPTRVELKKGHFGNSAFVAVGAENLVPEDIRHCRGNFSSQHGTGATYTTEKGIDGRADVVRINVAGTPGNNYYAYFGITDALVSQVDEVLSISYEYKIIKGSGYPTIGTVYADGFKNPDSSSYGDFGPVLTESLEDGWVRSSRNVRITLGGNSYFRWNFFSNEEESEVLVDNFQIERGPTAMPFVDGSKGDGILQYPIEVLNYAEGTLSFWMKHPAQMPYFNGGRMDAYVSTGNDYSPTDSLVMGKSGAYDSRILGIHWGGVNGSYMHCSDELPAVPAFIPENWNMITISWNKDVGYKYYINGVLIQDKRLGAGDKLKPFEAKKLVFKRIAIDELRIERKQVSLEEIQAWAASGLHYNYLDYTGYVD